MAIIDSAMVTLFIVEMLMPTEAVNLKIYHHIMHYTFYDHFLFFF